MFVDRTLTSGYTQKKEFQRGRHLYHERKTYSSPDIVHWMIIARHYLFDLFFLVRQENHICKEKFLFRNIFTCDNAIFSACFSLCTIQCTLGCRVRLGESLTYYMYY
jgi:hypothetical protein